MQPLTARAMSNSSLLTPRAVLCPADTIVAAATSPGPGARAIIRVSGPSAWEIVGGVVRFEPAAPAEICRGIWHGQINLGALAAPMPVMALAWKAPCSYTGQDLVEIHMLSSPPLVNLAMTRLLDAGARTAQPGEYTLRAFLAGKLDLTQAEAVLSVIEAGDGQELLLALEQLAGGVAWPTDLLRLELLGILAEVEAGLDFAEEDIEFISRPELRRRLGRAEQALGQLLTQTVERSTTDRPFRVVLAGKPNAGKSSLFNALVGACSALVSAQVGTTRDYLTQRVRWDGVDLEFVDTAGAAAAGSDIELQAQEGRAAQIKLADLVLWCVDSSAGDPKCEGDLHEPSWEKLLRVQTKWDLMKEPHCADPITVASAVEPIPLTSAATGAGIEDLKLDLTRRARRHRRRDAMATSSGRCRHHLAAAHHHVLQAEAILDRSEPTELLALELRSAIDEIGTLTGAVYTDDLLDRIFGQFCIGK